MKNKSILIILIFLLSLFIQVYFGYAQEKKPIFIGVVGPETGLYGYVGTDQYLGVQIATDEINSTGGIGGRKIEIIHRDDEGNPVKGVNSVMEFIEKYNVIGWFGSTATTSTIAIAEMTNDLRRIMIGVLGTSYRVVYPQGKGTNPRPWVFRISMGDWSQGSKLAEYAAKKYKKLAIVHDTSAYGITGKEYIAEELKKYGVTPIAVEGVAMRTHDFTSQLIKFRSASVEAVITWADQESVAHLALGRKALNYKLDIIGSNTLVALPGYKELAKDAADGSISVLLKDVVEKTPGVEKFNLDYQKKVGKDTIPTDYGVESYVSAKILFEAIGKVGTDPENLRNYLNNLKNYNTIIGPISFSETDHEAIKAEHLAIVTIKGGKVVKLVE